MKSNHLMRRLGRVLLASSFLLGIAMATSIPAQAQWPWGRNDDYRRDRGYRRNDPWGRNGGYYGNQIALSRGYQDGLYTGQNDARRGQSYNPQRSHFYRDATDGYDRRFGNRGQYKQAFRNAFLRGYEEGFRRYGGYNRRGGYGRQTPFPFPW